MAKVKEIRDMADEQIRLVWKDAAETLFRLRIQAQTEKLAAPTEMKKHRRTIARCQTILSQRGTLAPAAPVATACLRKRCCCLICPTCASVVNSSRTTMPTRRINCANTNGLMRCSLIATPRNVAAPRCFLILTKSANPAAIAIIV